MKEVVLSNIIELPKVVESFLTKYKKYKVMAFYGEMGAGKTTLIKEICLQLNVTDNIASPTFSLINEYSDGNEIIAYHFDFYRIENYMEAFDIGYEDYIYSGKYCFIEWPEKIDKLLPDNHLKINIEVINTQSRKLIIHN